MNPGQMINVFCPTCGHPITASAHQFPVTCLCKERVSLPKVQMCGRCGRHEADVEAGDDFCRSCRNGQDFEDDARIDAAYESNVEDTANAY